MEALRFPIPLHLNRAICRLTLAPMKNSPLICKLSLAAAAFVAALIPAVAGAQGSNSGSRALKIVVPIPPGVSTDLLARLLAPKLGTALGQAVIVENQGGASGMIGADAVARSAPDGQTLLFATTSQMITAPLLSKSVTYDPVKSFTPVMIAVEPVTLLVMHPAVPVSSFSELVDYAKRNPGKLRYGSAGIGSYFHLVGEAMNAAAGTDIVHVPYKSVVQSQNDVVGGQIELSFAAVASSTPFVNAGKLKIIALVENKRWAAKPDIQTIGEVAPGYRKPPAWFSFFGPAGMPQPVVTRLHAELDKALHAPDVRTWLDTNAIALIASTAEQLAASLKGGLEIYAGLIKRAGIRPE
jgi:tripartite-type tricarboxylate transporter receptor subunit TctC